MPSVNTYFWKPVSTVWLDGPSMMTALPRQVMLASTRRKPNVMVSLPPSASMRALPGSTVKLSSSGVPVSQVLTWMVAWSLSTSAPPEPVLPPSSVVSVSVSSPKKSSAPRYTTLPAAASSALICASVPESVTLPPPLPSTVAPPTAATVSVPCATDSVVVNVAELASTSVIASPPSAASVFASTSYEVGAVLTGASLTAVNVTVASPRLASPPPSSTLKLRPSGPRPDRP